ncbi:MAG TPA: hypothetical protein VHV08_09750 [Pirellulales bacterium]|nr:hypothetical protein [Pirellulales bacterium]
MKSLIYLTLAFAACGTVIARAQDCCNQCGCSCDCCKVCRCVPITKKVPKITYSCECEDFCIPGPSDRCVVHDECGHRKHVYTPTCAHMRTRKKLVKHETMEEVQSYKWVVENLCCKCAAKTGDDQASNHPAPTAARAAAEAQQVQYEAPADSGDTASGARPAGGFSAQLRRLLGGDRP